MGLAQVKHIIVSFELRFWMKRFIFIWLGLAQVKHTRVKDLTCSERQRLNVACHLLLDADMVRTTLLMPFIWTQNYCRLFERKLLLITKTKIFSFLCLIRPMKKWTIFLVPKVLSSNLDPPRKLFHFSMNEV